MSKPIPSPANASGASTPSIVFGEGAGGRSPAERRAFLRATFGLLGGAVACTALCTSLGLAVAIPAGWSFSLLIGAIALFFVMQWAANTKRRAVAALSLLAFAVCEGFAMAPFAKEHLNGPQGAWALAAALGVTAGMFIGSAVYTKISRRDFSFMGSFLFAGLLTIIAMSVLSILAHVPALRTLADGAATLVFAGYLLFDLSRIWGGAEDDPVFAATGVYLSLANLFMSLTDLFDGE